MPLASCHCGAVSVDVARRPRQLTDCNCSVCRRYGALWAYYTRRSVRVDAAPDALVSYAWGARTLDFLHCRTCGCVVLWRSRRERGPDARIGINARMLEPSVIAGLPIRHLDGADTWRFLD
jgi:hypothetical protein